MSESAQMSAFARLTPALQRQVVNSLGWTALRPVQAQTIDAVLDDRDCVVLAPTAGGKTEAGVLPLLTRMEEGQWAATSVLYLSPIRALLNNQEARLQRLTGLVGRRAMTWHGDVHQRARQRILSAPPDILAITPESIEAMLISARVERRGLLMNLRAVLIDEVHAFVSSDRGAHLVALLRRVERLCGRRLQRIGLSATVGDPEAILGWLSREAGWPGAVIDPGADPGASAPEVRLDHVYNVENAARVVSLLHGGEKRLLFADSRRLVESIGQALGALGVNAHITHASLSASRRRLAERAFEEGQGCVIVSTSALELGIDVGDLDRVLQVEAPASVASFLQRMGRTGRRPGAVANCTLLTTTPSALWRAAGLLRLHAQGFVEPTAPTRRAYHVLAHQALALALQETGVPRDRWWRWIEGASAFSEITQRERDLLIDHLVAEDLLAEVGHRLVMGDEGTRRFGKKRFMELFAVFSTPPILRVMHNMDEVGALDVFFIHGLGDQRPIVFVLGGRVWSVTSIDWRRALCFVEPALAQAPGTLPSWMGEAQLLHQPLCQAMHAVICEDDAPASWSRRAREGIDALRAEHRFLRDGLDQLHPQGAALVWWSFAGGRANHLLARALEGLLGDSVRADNLKVTFRDDAAQSEVAIRSALRALQDPEALSRAADAAAAEPARDRSRAKFAGCLPLELEARLQRDLWMDEAAARDALKVWT